MDWTTYKVIELVKDKKPVYMLYRDGETLEITPSKYLKYLYLVSESPNTIRAAAYALSFYYSFLNIHQLDIKSVSEEMSFLEQSRHFTSFLRWVKEGNHNQNNSYPSNKTCNKYLRVVFQFYGYLYANDETSKPLKVVTTGGIDYYNEYGVKRTAYGIHFKGFLKEEDGSVEEIPFEDIKVLYEACTNDRDRLLISILTETGLRIGETLGLHYTEDIDIDKRTIEVNARDDNENRARDKNAEHRILGFSEETAVLMSMYISDNYELLKNTDFLFVKLKGKHKGSPMEVGEVYSMLNRLADKTNIKTSPHKLRHYFANERRRNNWDLNDIRYALGHKSLETTIRYLGKDMERLSEMSDQYFEENEELFILGDLIKA